MSRRRPSRGRWSRVLAALCFAIGALGYGVVRSVDEERFLRSAEQALGEAAGVRVHLGSARLHLGSELGLSVGDIRVVEPTTGETLLEADGLVLGLKLAPLGQGRLEFGDLALRTPVIHLTRDAEGDLNLTPLLDRLAMHEEPIEVEVPVPLGQRIPSTLRIDTVRLEAAELTWLDQMEESPRRRVVLGPASLYAVRNGRPFGATFTLEAMANPDTVHARIALEGAVGGDEDLAWLGDLELDASGRVQGLHLGEASGLVGRAVELDLELDGILEADLSFHGKLAGDFDGNVDLRARDARWHVPAVWRRPLASEVVRVAANVARRDDSIRFEKLSIRTDDSLLEGRLALADLATDDPWIETDVSSEEMDVARVRHMIPDGVIDSEVLDYIVDLVEGGRGRVERFTGAGHLSDWENCDLPEHYDVMFGHFVLSDLRGIPFEGMERMTGVGGDLLLEEGDLRFRSFTARYGTSELTHLEGAVTEVLGHDTGLDVTVTDGEIQLAELRDFLTSPAFGDDLRAFLDRFVVRGGVASGTRFRFVTDFEDRMEYSGTATLADGAIGISDGDLLFEGIAGPIEIDERDFRTEGLAAHLGQSRFEVGGSVWDYARETELELVLDVPLLTGRDLYRLIGSEPPPVDAGSFSGRVWLSGPPELPPELGIEARGRVEALDLAPPLERGTLTDLTGTVELGPDALDFALDDLVWRDHHLAASGRALALYSDRPHITVDAKALEEVDLERLTRAEPGEDEDEDGPEGPEGSEPAGDGGRAPVVDGRFEIDRARYRETSFAALSAGFRQNGDVLRLDPIEGYALGGMLAGSAALRSGDEGDPEIDVELGIERMDADGLMRLLDIDRPRLEGRASASAALSLRWPPREHLEDIDGRVKLDLGDGRIHEGIFLWKVFDLLDLPRLLSNPVDVWQTGLGFDRIAGELSFGDAKLSTTALEIDGDSVDLVLAGHLDLETRELDGVVTVAPLGMVDRILLDPLPSVGPLEPNALTDYAFRVTGPIDGASVRLEALDRVQGFLDGLVRGRRARPSDGGGSP